MFGFLILAALLVFVAVIAIRTATFKPKPQPALSDEVINFDKDAAVSALAELVKCKTISYSDASLEDNAEFEKLIAKLPELYPNVFKVCDFQQLPHRGLLFKWAGKSSGDPAILMAHYDVVPVEESGWDKPAFAQMLPALFGGLGVAFVSKNWKIAIAPVLLMLVLFIFVPALNAGTVGIMVPVSVLFTIGMSRILYKKGVL